MAECIVLSSEAESAVSDDELPSAASIYKGTGRLWKEREFAEPSVETARDTLSDVPSLSDDALNPREAKRRKREEDKRKKEEDKRKREEDKRKKEEDKRKREEVKHKREEERELKRKVREQKKAEKEREKTLHRIVNQAEMDSRKETQPSQRVKQIIVQLETALTESPDLMTSLLGQLQELGVQYRVVSTSWPGSVCWKRKNTTRSLNEDLMDVVENVQETDEQYMLVVMPGKDFLELILASKLDQMGQPGTTTLLQHVQSLLHEYPLRKPVLIVNNLDAALRAQKTRRNRQFRAAIRTNQIAEETNVVEVSLVDCENFMVNLQLMTECCVRLCSSQEQIADLIVTYTKALADLPFKKDTHFSFYGDLGPGATRKALQETKNKTGLIWHHQLLQYPGVSNAIASAIASTFPSPAHLLKAYSNCTSCGEAELLLEDIQVRRGAGVVASTRRVGAAISKRIHFAMTCREPSKLLPN